MTMYSDFFFFHYDSEVELCTVAQSSDYTPSSSKTEMFYRGMIQKRDFHSSMAAFCS